MGDDIETGSDYWAAYIALVEQKSKQTDDRPKPMSSPINKPAYFVEKIKEIKVHEKIRRFRIRENMWWAWPRKRLPLAISLDGLAHFLDAGLECLQCIDN